MRVKKKLPYRAQMLGSTGQEVRGFRGKRAKERMRPGPVQSAVTLHTEVAGTSFSFFELGGEPIEALVQTVSSGGARGLDVPVALTQGL